MMALSQHLIFGLINNKTKKEKKIQKEKECRDHGSKRVALTRTFTMNGFKAARSGQKK